MNLLSFRPLIWSIFLLVLLVAAIGYGIFKLAVVTGALFYSACLELDE